MVNKLENGSNITKKASQPSNKAQPLKKKQKTVEEHKLEYARSAYMNVRRPHIKSGIGYKTGNQHNTRVNTKVKNSSSSPRPISNRRRSKASRPLTMFLTLILMLLIFLICRIMILMLLMCL
jgi:hypothetical protein